MSENKETIQDHRENEDVTPVSEVEGPEITPVDQAETEPQVGNDTDRLNAELAEMKDRFMRLYSEFDNFRKRTQKERVELLKSANAEVISALLPVLDDFERAMKYESAKDEKGSEKEGAALIYHKFKSILEGKGLKRMISIGEDFNADHHEAITTIPAQDESMIGKVIDEAECGYFLNDKLIRHAKVIVGS